MKDLTALAVLGLALAACDSNDPETVELSALGAALTSAQCDLSVRCAVLPDAASCDAIESIGDGLTAYQAAVAAGRLTYDGVQAATCLSTIRNASCTTDLDLTGDASCGKVFVGQVAVGGTCYEGDDCAAGSACSWSAPCAANTCCAGTCVTESIAQVGESCSDKRCVDDAVCVFDTMGGDSTCRARVAAGGSCQSRECQKGLYCDRATDAQTGTCKAAGAHGGACSLSSFYSCRDIADTCNPTTLVCETRKAIAATCNPQVQDCVLYAYCGASAVCAANASVGETCSDTMGPPCLGNLSCDNGRCTQSNDARPSCP